MAKIGISHLTESRSKSLMSKSTMMRVSSGRKRLHTWAVEQILWWALPVHYLSQFSLPLPTFIASRSGMIKGEKGGQRERDTKLYSWIGVCAYSGHWAGKKMGGIPYQDAEKAEITHEDMRGTLRLLLLTTGEKENSEAPILLGEDRKAAYQQITPCITITSKFLSVESP